MNSVKCEKYEMCSENSQFKSFYHLSPFYSGEWAGTNNGHALTHAKKKKQIHNK